MGDYEWVELGAKISIEKFICRDVLCGNFVLISMKDNWVEKIVQHCEKIYTIGIMFLHTFVF